MDQVNEHHDILAIFLQNFEHYMGKAREFIQKKLDENPAFEINSLSDKCLYDKFIHSD